MLKNQRGGAAVEFALVLPLLAIILFGTFDLALLFYNKQVITNASREVARSRIVEIDPTKPSINYKNIAIQYGSKLINLGDSTNNALTTSDIDIDISVTDYVTVKITYDYKHLFSLDFFGSNFGIANTQITGQTTMRSE